MKNITDLKVIMLSSIYGPTANGYRIISAEKECGEKIVVGGQTIAENIEEGDEIVVDGWWKHSDRGTMLVATSAKRTLPQTEKGLRIWLTKAKIPGIGKVRAERLVDNFGLKAIDKLINKDPEALKAVGPKALNNASLILISRKKEIEIGTMLSGYGIGGSIQAKLMKYYGDRLQSILENRPYELTKSIKGIAFNTADKIANSTGISKEDPNRIKAGIRDRLDVNSKEGSTAILHEKLLENTSKLLNVNYTLIENEIREMQLDGSIKRIRIDGKTGWISKKFNETEEKIAENIVNKSKEKQIFSNQDIEYAVNLSEKKLNVNLNQKQKEAAIASLKYPIAILTGGPGTGKTKTLETILNAWKILIQSKKYNLSNNLIALAAPTGRAAKRASEVTGVEGKTIHRLLEYNPETKRFDRNKSNIIEAGFITIDESSMPDIFIMKDLSEAWGKSKILLIGDVDQLPSVGPGKVLSDLINSKIIPTISLTEIYRQSAGSSIALGATEVKEGRFPQVRDPGKGELVFIELQDPSEVANRIKDMYINKMPTYLAKNNLDSSSIQILSPGKQGEVGTINLNKIIQENIHGINPDGPSVKLSDNMMGRIGDKVIQLENDYEKNIFNGDTGKIIEIETNIKSEPIETHVDFGDKVVTFKGSSIANLTLSYALTIHKSQGSEYQVVIIPVTGTHFTLNKRPLIYTGMTRAKKICVFVGTKKALITAIKREDTGNRITTLQKRIEAKCV